MPAGSGPMAVPVATAQLATTAETVIATIPPSNWNNPSGLGNLVSAFLAATSTGAATLTLRIRQTSLTGAQVGTSIIYVFAGAATDVPVGAEFADTSAFGVGPTAGGQYVLTAQASVASTVTPAGGVLELETIAPVD